MQGKARYILILQKITEFYITGSAGLKRSNNGRNVVLVLWINNRREQMSLHSDINLIPIQSHWCYSLDACLADKQ